MKNLILTVLTFIGLSLGSTNAQSCCTTQKEKCNPEVCCPIMPKCCGDDILPSDNVNTSLDSQKTKKTVPTTRTINNNTVALKKEVSAVEPKNTKI